jgi:hypothetical protein
MPDRRFIHTHPGFGYRFQPQPAREAAGVRVAAAIESPSVDGVLSRDVHIGGPGD